MHILVYMYINNLFSTYVNKLSVLLQNFWIEVNVLFVGMDTDTQTILCHNLP